MSKEGILIVLGVCVLLSPFLGLPYRFLMWILLGLGLTIALVAFFLRSHRMKETARREMTYEEAVS